MSQAGNNNVTANPSVPVQFTGNTGVAVPAANNLNVVTANSNVEFTGSGDTLTLNFGLPNIALGNDAASITTASGNVGLGMFTFASLTSGAQNTVVGNASGALITTGTNNTIMGYNAASLLATSDLNVVIGVSSLATFNAVAGSGRNTIVGSAAAIGLASGLNNIVLGAAAGSAYVGAESSNILINNSGVAAESNTIRIGTQGTGLGQQSQTYIAGVMNTVSGRVVKVTAPGAYPYATLITDDVILVDTSAARTINPIAAPVTGTRYTIKDSVGSAAANNITITPTGKNIDGAASFVINSNYGSVTIVYNGTEWSVI